MEGVIAAKNADRDTPVIWLSGDDGFGAQSYRLGCTYFHKKPIPHEKLKEALHKCLSLIHIFDLVILDIFSRFLSILVVKISDSFGYALSLIHI